MISAGELRKGIAIKFNNEIHMVVEAIHYKPTKGGGLMRTKLRNINKATLFDHTFGTSEKLETVDISWRRMQYLYAEGDEHVFMDNETYEQYHIPDSTIGDDTIKWLMPEMNIDIALHDNSPLLFNIGLNVEQKVTHTEPGIKGDTVSSTTKPAEIESGVTIQVPLFIKIGDKIKIDVRDGSYLERVKS